MKESAKSKQYWGVLEREATSGKGIDIGCGPDPVTPDCRAFDLADGDANCITKYVHEEYDFVYSSHCLEHMRDPEAALREWWSLVKPGGWLFLVVPDEDLYEQGGFPSRFNRDHKSTFTISKASSWSPRSYNVLSLAQGLPGGEIAALQLQDRGYDRALMSFGTRKATVPARLLARLYGVLCGLVGNERLAPLRRALTLYFPVDQTTEAFEAQAQIQLIMRKAR